MPRGFRTEDGPRPEFADLDGATEHESAEYPDRTEANIREADMSLVFNHGPEWSAGTVSATTKARARKIPSLVVEPARTPGGFGVVRLHRTGADGSTRQEEVAADERAVAATRELLARHRVRALHVGGNGEASTPGIGAFVERFLVAALGHPARP